MVKLDESQFTAKTLHFAMAGAAVGIYEQIDRGGIAKLVKQTIIDEADIADVERIYGSVLNFNRYINQGEDQYRVELKRVWNLAKEAGLAGGISSLIEAICGCAPLVAEARSSIDIGWVLPPGIERSILTPTGIDPSIILYGRRNGAATLNIYFTDLMRFSKDSVHIAESSWGLFNPAATNRQVIIGRGVGRWIFRLDSRALVSPSGTVDAFHVNEHPAINAAPLFPITRVILTALDGVITHISSSNPLVTFTPVGNGVTNASFDAPPNASLSDVSVVFTGKQLQVEIVDVQQSLTSGPFSAGDIYIGVNGANPVSSLFVIDDDVNTTKDKLGMLRYIKRWIPAHIRLNVIDIDGSILDPNTSQFYVSSLGAVAPPTPTNLAATPGNTQVSLVWT